MGGRTLTASEALRVGLVTRVLWPDRFQVELLPSLRAMSDQSSQVSYICITMFLDFNFINAFAIYFTRYILYFTYIILLNF